MAQTRRSFLRSSSALFTTALAMGALRPSFSFAQTPPGRFKNIIEIFAYGGWDARHVFPMSAGPVDAFLRSVRPNLSVPAGDVLTPNGFDQAGRDNLVGFHPGWAPLLQAINGQVPEVAVNAGISLITEFGITSNMSFSHEVAQKQYRNGASENPAQIDRGWVGRVADAYQQPLYTVWGLGLNEPSLFNTNGAARPLVVSNLASFNHASQNFGQVDCATLPGNPCAAAGSDRIVSAADNAAHVRRVLEQLSAEPQTDLPPAINDAVRGAQQGMFSAVPVLQQMAGITLTTAQLAQFAPPGQGRSGLANTLIDIARIIEYVQTNSSVSPAVRASTKLFSCGLGGWDTHAGQANAINNNLVALAWSLRGLIAYLESRGHLQDTLIVVMSEFGRTTRQNGSAGTDHAGSNYGLVLGGGTKVARRVVGGQPSLAQAQSQNYFTPQVAMTGTLKQILRASGFDAARFPQIFPTGMPNEVDLPFLTI
jgi:uncharacterized protein (DUF1501 family)